jgi:hypothetical protein
VGIFGRAVFAVFAHFLTPLLPYSTNKPIICNTQCSHGTGRKCHPSRIVLQDVPRTVHLPSAVVLVQQPHVQDPTFAFAKAFPPHHIGCFAHRSSCEYCPLFKAMLVRYSGSRTTPLSLPPYRHNLRCHPPIQLDGSRAAMRNSISGEAESIFAVQPQQKFM